MSGLGFQAILSNEESRSLGLICVRWAQLEMLIELCLYRLVGIGMFDPTQPREMSAKLTKAKTFVETNLADKAQRKRMIEVFDRGILLAVKRNLAVHGKWAIDVHTGERKAVSWFQVKLPAPLNELTASALPQIEQEIVALIGEVQEFLYSQAVLPRP